MKRVCLSVVCFLFFVGASFLITDSDRLRAEEVQRFMLQTAAFPTLDAALREIERLKALGVTASYLIKEDQARNKWYAVYINLYPNREEAAREGSRLIQQGIIRNFFIFPHRGLEEGPKSSEVSETFSPRLGTAVGKKDLAKPMDKRPLFFGPIVVKEEETQILMTIGLDRRVFPKIYTQKNDLNSRLFVTFPPVDKILVPVDFRKDQQQALLSFSITQKNTECTFILVLNPSYNYEVSQNYFEKEKLYALRIRWETAGGNRKD